MDNEETIEENTYEYACMRAELLGLPKPNKEDFDREVKEKLASRNSVDEDGIDCAQLEEVDLQNENLKNISGGLDELNSILSITQKKLNTFKGVCGSFTNLLKIKSGYGGSSDSINKNQENLPEPCNEAIDPSCSTNQQSGGSQKQQDLLKGVDTSVNKLDSLLDKAENAHYSLAQQNKQIKSYLK